MNIDINTKVKLACNNQMQSFIIYSFILYFKTEDINEF